MLVKFNPEKEKLVEFTLEKQKITLQLEGKRKYGCEGAH
jgi:hypothetical protein